MWSGLIAEVWKQTHTVWSLPNTAFTLLTAVPIPRRNWESRVGPSGLFATRAAEEESAINTMDQRVATYGYAVDDLCVFSAMFVQRVRCEDEVIKPDIGN